MQLFFQEKQLVSLNNVIRSFEFDRVFKEYSQDIEQVVW
ncbi:hypothetical protein SAMN05216326_10133 [Nitrosomonas marina]|uniref:Uncharacterized protein n=1 Tax=Nitrosomonas marina TaxID=917 RepID=A0A1H9Y2F2_9PROT|nr:hypothetical protein SAMN05216326_10133 [Nitrosomonas marina]